MRDDDEVEDLIAERQAANPRRTPGREPVGAPQTRTLIHATLGILAAVSVLLVVVLLVSG